MSGKSQNEFIQLLADAVREDIATEVSHSEMFRSWLTQRQTCLYATWMQMTSQQKDLFK